MWISPVAALCAIASIASAQFEYDYHGSHRDLRDRGPIRSQRPGSVLGIERDRFGQNPGISDPNLGPVSPVFQNRPITDPRGGIFPDDLGHGRRQPFENDRRLPLSVPLDPRGRNPFQQNVLSQNNPRFQGPGRLRPIETDFEFSHDRKFGVGPQVDPRGPFTGPQGLLLNHPIEIDREFPQERRFGVRPQSDPRRSGVRPIGFPGEGTVYGHQSPYH